MLAVLSGARSYRGTITFLARRRGHLNPHFGDEPAAGAGGEHAADGAAVVAGRGPRRSVPAPCQGPAGRGLLAGGEAGEQPVIALDGTTLRGSFDPLNDRKAAQTLPAFASAAAIVLAHTGIDDKSNEIPAAQQMIRAPGRRGVVFTADALHCQKNL